MPAKVISDNTVPLKIYVWLRNGCEIFRRNQNIQSRKGKFSKNTLIKQTIRITHEKVSMKINYNENVLLLEICKNYVQCTFLELLNLNFTLFIKVKCAKKILNPFF